MARGMSPTAALLVAVAACALAGFAGAERPYTDARGVTHDNGVFGLFGKTIGTGIFEEVKRAKKQLEAELETGKDAMKELAEAHLREMLAKIQSGEMSIQDELGEESNGTHGRGLLEGYPFGFPQPQAWGEKMADIGNAVNSVGQDLATAAELLKRKRDWRRCTFFGGPDVCLPTKRLFVRKSVSFACDFYIKKKVPDQQFLECGRPGSTTALCLEWPLEIVISSFVTPITLPICLPDARAVDAILRVLGGDVLAALNLFL